MSGVRLESGWTRRSREVLDPAAPGSREARICRMIFDEICVLANGDIVCSCGDPAGKRIYGNVHRDRIADVYDGPRYRGMRRAQLAAPPSSWCPVIDADCGGRISRPGRLDRESGRHVRMLQLEPISACNLSCPACPVTHFGRDPAYRLDRAATLPLETMLDVVDQLPDLEKLLFYNFGEPFLHPHAIDFLRALRLRRPDVAIHTSTNGLVLSDSKIEALVRESLVDRIVFSIDGARPKSYARYRAGGSLPRALGALDRFATELRHHPGGRRIEVIWQYILFEWNDSDGEIGEARTLARDLGVPIQWVLTHTEGRSRRFLGDDPTALARLDGGDAWALETCDARLLSLWRERGVALGSFAAHLDSPVDQVSSRAGARIALPLRLENRSSSPWRDRPEAVHQIGVQWRSPSGRLVREGPRLPLPEAARSEGGVADLVWDGFAPQEEGEWILRFDVVLDPLAWFQERGSRPLDVRIHVAGEPLAWSADPLVEVIATALGGSPIPEASEHWLRDRLDRGEAVETLLFGLAQVVEGAGRPERLYAARARTLELFGASPPPASQAAARAGTSKRRR